MMTSRSSPHPATARMTIQPEHRRMPRAEIGLARARARYKLLPARPRIRDDIIRLVRTRPQQRQRPARHVPQTNPPSFKPIHVRNRPPPPPPIRDDERQLFAPVKPLMQQAQIRFVGIHGKPRHRITNDKSPKTISKPRRMPQTPGLRYPQDPDFQQTNDLVTAPQRSPRLVLQVLNQLLRIRRFNDSVHIRSAHFPPAFRTPPRRRPQVVATLHASLGGLRRALEAVPTTTIRAPTKTTSQT